jgi:hypothetical protein
MTADALNLAMLLTMELRFLLGSLGDIIPDVPSFVVAINSNELSPNLILGVVGMMTRAPTFRSQ